jgi:hypothetical protein
MKRKYILFYSLVLLFSLAGCSNKQVQSPSILEIVDLDYRFSTTILQNFSLENNIDKSAIYEWQNHWVIYCESKDAQKIKDKLETRFPRLIINLYDKPFYNFNLQKLSNKKTSEEWENIIMTANLVADTTKQNEYMEYHRTQFEKWPEISKGFCNASFQQLLVFRNGRQLMLVISIPKGESLDKLNPKTTENNPRVNEWNSIMSKYQEGIEDAPKGTTWVMFSALH